MRLTAKQTDRAVGALLGGAVGDALGVPYELGSRALEAEPAMHGGGLGRLRSGQWSDDTEMALVIAEVAATGADLRTDSAQEAIAAGFLRWFAGGPPDVGIQTGGVLSETQRRGGGAAVLRQVSAALHERTAPRTGNGSLMRTGPVALAHLGDADAIAEAARAISALTHADPRAQEACLLWSLAVDHAIRTAELDVRVGLSRVDAGYWAPLLDEAERVRPAHYRRSNGWVVAALQGAWSAIHDDPSYAEGVVRAVSGGGDTDTVAAIAGTLLGARHGGTAVPARWRRILHGWPGLRSRDLVSLAMLTVRGGAPTSSGWPLAARMADRYGATDVVVPHPDDPGVLLGALGSLEMRSTDAVVSLCRIGTDEAGSTPDPADHVEFWLIDDEDVNNDVVGVVRDAAATVQALREEGKTVLLHCVHAQTRTPVVAAAYGSLITGSAFRPALQRVQAVLPSAGYPRRSIVAALEAADTAVA